MRNNLKQFLIGALLATVPMSYVVYNNIPHRHAVTRVKTAQNTIRVEEFMWSSKLISSNKTEAKTLASPDTVLSWTFAQSSGSIQSSEKIPTTTVTPTVTPKPRLEAAKKPENHPQTETTTYVVHTQPAPQDVGALIEKYASEYGVNKDMMVHIAKCESGFRSNAVNGPYAGIYQFIGSTWSSNRRAMGLDPDPTLRYNLEEAVKTAAFKMSRDGFGAWPVCQNKAKRLLGMNTEGI